MANQSDSQNVTKFPKFQKVPSAESFLLEHGGIKSGHEEYTSKVLPPRMRQVMQQNTAKVLRSIRSQLKKFASFVEGMQRKSQSEIQLFGGSSGPQAPKPTESSSTRSIKPADPRPKNAPLRDAFQMVRNLLWRISNVIDQVAADVPAEDDQRRNVQSPHFDHYYAQYVFQLTHYILMTVGEELEKFCKVLAEVSADDVLSKLPPKVDEIDVDLSSHKISPERSESFGDSEAAGRSSGISSEESRSASDFSLSNAEFKKQAQEALELLTFLSKKILDYFQERGLPKFDEIQQREFSKRALGIPDLCKNCSMKVARKLRRYTSRENLFAEKYEKSSDEALFSSETYKRKNSSQTHFIANTRGSHKSDSKTVNIQTVTKSRTNLGSTSTRTSDAGIKMTFQKQIGLFKSPSHWEPLVSGQTESATVTNQLKEPDDMIVSVITVTEDPGRPVKIDCTKHCDKIHFNLQEFCTLMKEQFRKLLSEESKSDASQSGTTDSNLIGNILIHCFREASKGAEGNITHSSIRFGVATHSADVHNNKSDIKPSKKEAPSAQEHEKQLDVAVEKFVRDTYQLAISALENKKSS